MLMEPKSWWDLKNHTHHHPRKHCFSLVELVNICEGPSEAPVHCSGFKKLQIWLDLESNQRAHCASSLLALGFIMVSTSTIQVRHVCCSMFREGT